jgi:tRNA U34 2-thiouridine synthase MnmA/TrmU
VHRPARGIAKGQAAVLYDAGKVLGSATISATSILASGTQEPAQVR